MRDWLRKLLFGETLVEMDARLKAKSLMLDVHLETLRGAQAIQNELGKVLVIRGAQLDAYQGQLLAWQTQLQAAAIAIRDELDLQRPTALH